MKPLQPDTNAAPARPDGQPEMIPDTVRFWEGRYGRPVSTEEAREMITAVVGFFSLLAVWDLAENKAETERQND